MKFTRKWIKATQIPFHHQNISNLIDKKRKEHDAKEFVHAMI